MDGTCSPGIDVVKNKLSAITFREAGMVILCALVIYLFRSRTTYDLKPQWRHDLDPELYRNGRFPQEQEHLPQSIITDLDGDGTNDIILLTNDFHLQILTVPKVDGSMTLPHTVVEHSIPLPVIEDELGMPAQLVAMQAGYLDHYDQSQPDRKQVIVLVLDSWDVLCLDHQLKTLWHQRVQEVGNMREDYKIQAMSVLISSIAVHSTDRGVVIVGGSFTHRHPDKLQQPGLAAGHSGVKLRQAGQSVLERPTDLNTHFSTFALAGTNGTVRWHHLPGDFKPKEKTKEPHHWKLGLSRDRGHIGQVHWSKFGSNLLKFMPHHWSGIHDTAFDLAQLQRDDSGSRPAPTASTSTVAGILGLRDRHDAGVPYGGMLPHADHEHIREPNALIQHSNAGIEVLRLSTGSPLTRMALPDSQSVYVDSNADGTVERVKAEYSGNKCQVEVTTLQPRISTMYVGSLCNRVSPGLRSFSAMFSQEIKVTEDTHLALAPVSVPSVASHQGMWRHLLGRSLDGAQRGYDSIFLTSTGLLTSFGPDGQHNWQVMVPSQWAEQTHLYKRHDATSDDGEIYHKAFKPSLSPFSPLIYSTQNTMLAVGWNRMTLVDLQDGYTLAEHSLPCQPLGKPVIGDFTNDGWTDIIVSCPNGYVGFGLSPKPPHLYMGILSLTVLLTMLLLSWCCTSDRNDEEIYYHRSQPS